MEIEKKMIYGLKKTKYMVINTGKEPEEVIEERVKEGIVQETDIYKYLGMVINKSGNLKDHTLKLNRKFEVINREIGAIGAKHQSGKEEIRVKLKPYKTCLMSALLYGLETWRKIDKDEMNEIEKIQKRVLKRIFKLSISTSYIGSILETGTWPANQRIQYSTMMLYHNIMNSGHKRITRKILAEETISNYKNTMISKVQQIAQGIGVKLKNVENISKSKCKKQVEGKIGKPIEERTKQEMTNKTKASTIIEDKWERKKYLQECDRETIKHVIKIRLHMWQVSCNYKRDNTDTKCSLCKKLEDTVKHVLECEKDKKFALSKENSKGEWEEITEIYMKNKQKRELEVIKVQD